MENYCLCLHTLIPVRLTPSESAEMVTQILFGEQYILNEYIDNWASIKLINDGYHGWIDKKLVQTINETQKTILDASNKTIINKPFNIIYNKKTQQEQALIAGSELYLSGNNLMQEIFSWNNAIFDDVIRIQDIAMKFVNAPYLWGGKSILGIDCSGLMQVLFKTQGIQLPRDASEQAKLGTDISFIHEAKTGDLAFFDNSEGKIIHVGLFLTAKTIIHASGNVRIDPIDHQGIYKTEEKKYSHKLRIIKRVIY